MLVESMNPVEITREILKDFDKLKTTTVERLGNEYDRERRKLKIDSGKSFPKMYPVKTASKNTWLLFLSKAPSEERYKGRDSINVLYVVYYYNAKGLKVFYKSSANFIEVYNNHFFKRFNERMNLKLENPLDIVKNYFMYGGHSVYSVVLKNGKEYTIGVSSEGLLLGELYQNRLWLINKTFISRDIARRDQDELESELITLLKADIESTLSLFENNSDHLRNNKNVLNAITNTVKD